MVQIKSLLLENFKSFGGKRTIKFMNGLNMIIGPNGSGKSNVAEAISFVLGRMSKKALRTERLSHVIFNGGKKGKPADYSTVKLVFSNEEKIFPVEDEYVEIGRKVNKDGHSNYYLNGKKTTRTNIINVLDYAGLEPDGFNMIMQGKIAELVDMSPDERREIIEQISGIATYEEKKEKAEKEMNKVKEKIKETRILLKEREKHLKELKKEKKKAEKYRNTKKEIKRTKARLILKKMKETEERLEKTEENIKKNKEDVKKYREKININNNRLKEIEEKISFLNQNLGAKGAEKQKKLQKKIIEIKNEINSYKNSLESHKNEIERIERRKSNIHNNLEEAEKQVSNIQKEIEEYDEKIKNKREKIKDIKKQASSSKEINYFDLKERINILKDELVDLRSEDKDMITQQENFRNYKDNMENIVHKKNLLNKIEEKLEQKMEINSSIAIKVERAEEKVNTMRRKIERLKTRKYMRSKAMGKSVKAILNKGFDGVHGTVIQLGNASNEKYDTALRVGAGSRLKNIVVDNENTAEECINFLRKNKLGVATLLPINKIRGFDNFRKELITIDGVIDFAVNLIDFNHEYKKIFNYIYRDTLVVKDMNAAKRVGIGRVRMVTLEGDLISTSGAISGGYRRKKSSLSMNVDINKRIDYFKKKKDKNSEIYEKLVNQKNENDRLIMKYREERASLKSDVRNLEILGEEYKTKSEGFDAKKLSKVRDRIEELSDELNKKRKEVSEFEKTFNMKTFEEKKLEVNKLEEELNELKVDRGIKKSHLNNIIKKDITRLKKITGELDKEKEKFVEEIEKIKNKIKNSEEQLKTYEKEEKSFEKKLSDNYKERDKLEEERRKLETTNEKLRVNIKDDEEKNNNLKLLIAEIKSKIEGFRMRYEPYEHLDVKEPRKSVKELEEKIFLLEKKLEKFGNVNLKALDVFKNVEEEYNKIRDKMNRLEEENNAIIETIKEIEKKKTNTFMETFNEIRNNFERIFGILSPGGIANMIIENEEEPLKGGIDIKARPRGKKFLTLKSMSGGEKTITALSLIFAIQEYSPAPFYIFDEVDAALDKENATKFAELCDQYGDKAQLLLISHNDNVVSVADYLYGVSMKPSGVSKIVSLKLPE